MKYSPSHLETVSENPRVSVVIPTYNRAAELQGTLSSLAEQTLASSAYEVIVADDGSTDSTYDVVRSFGGKVALKYFHQEDLGARAGVARNAGARMAAAPLLVFMDSGTLAGPRFLAGHLAEHADAAAAGESAAVIGYTYGYRPFDPTPGLADALETLAPQDLWQRYHDDPSFQDCRHPEFASAGYDVHALPLPWIMFWTMNVSVGAAEFWRAGGFDETFQGWGAEDLDLGFRLYRQGARFRLGRDAWAIETPHERDPASHAESVTRNALHMLTKSPEPALELNWAWFATGQWLREPNSSALHAQYRSVLAWTHEARGLHVEDEIRQAIRDASPASSIAVFGCGGSLPETLRGAIVLDFDAELLAEAASGDDGHHAHSIHRTHSVHHAIGLRTDLPDQSVDLVIITSRLEGLWRSYGELILAEAHRIGARVQTQIRLHADCPP